MLLKHIRIKDPNGKSIVELGSLQAFGLDLLRGSDQVIRVKGNQLQATLVREKNGRFDIQDYLPEPKGKPSTIPYDITIDRCQVKYVDRTGPVEWAESITTPQVKVIGVGQEWIASATAQIAGNGAINTQIQNQGDIGLQISGSTKGLELGPILAHFALTPEARPLEILKNLSTGSLRVQGPFRLSIPKGKTPNVETRVQAEIASFQFRQYKASRIRFDGIVDTQGLAGTVEMQEGQVRAKFSGSARWIDHPTIAGNLTVLPINSGDLPRWLNPYIPKNVAFQKGGFSGWVSAKSATDFHVLGDVMASTASYSGEQITGLRVGVDLTRQRASFDVKQASYGQQAINGGFTIDPMKGTISGAASSQRIDIGRVAGRFGYHQVKGLASISALVDGKIADPNITFVVRGQGKVTVTPKHTLSLGRFEALGRYAKGSLRLDRAYFDTPEGLLTAHGSLGATGSLGINISGRGIQIGAYDPSIAGTANFAARVSGTLRNPFAVGRVEGFELSYKDQLLPALVANFRIDRHLARLDGLEAARGTTSVQGAAQLRFPSGRLSGQLAIHDVQIADWLGDEFIGAIDIPTIDVSGTMSHPVVDATLKGNSLVARGVKVDQLEARLHADGLSVRLQDLSLAGADGHIHATGMYDFNHRIGNAIASAVDLSLDKLVPELSDSIAVEGKVSGQASVDLLDLRLHHAKVMGKLDRVTINGSPLGSGPWSVQSDGQRYTGDLEIGDLERYITVDSVVFDPQTKRGSGELSLFNIKAENLVSASLRYFPSLSFETRDDLQTVKGVVNLSSTFDGTIEDPGITIKSLQATDIKFRGQMVGDLNTNFALRNHKWDIHSFSVSKGPILLALSGSIDEHGDTHIDGNTDNRIDLSKIGLFDSRFSALTGSARLWFNADGPTKTPHIVASLEVKNLLANPLRPTSPNDEDKNLSFNLDKIDITPSFGISGGISMVGVFTYKGLRGDLQASAPFEYPFKIASSGLASAKITFAESKLTNIAPLIDGLDGARSSGSVTGELTAEGNASSVKVSGFLKLLADSLAFKGVEDSFKKVNASITLKPNVLDLNAKAESSRGGTLEASASTPVEDLGQLIAQIHKDGAASLLDRTVSGHASMKGMQFRQGVLVKSTASGTVSAEIDLRGTMRIPTFDGKVDVLNGAFDFKGLPPSTSQPSDFPINPRFNLKLALLSPTRLQSSTANMYLLGNGTLQGSLQFPKATSTLYVDHGTVRLPAALLRLDQGGTVQASYVSNRTSTTAVANVDLEGSTSVTASRTGETDVQRYDITLGMKGDLLQDQGISLTASSDPPDLSQDRILAILGQTAILQNLSSGFKQSEAVGAAAQFIVPSLLDPLTAQFAKGLGLDFLSLEYNVFDQASVTFGKSLGSGFSVTGSRQLSEPPPGFPSRFDFRLVYRPRRLPGALNRIRFFFGADQERPWKLGLDYSIRF